MELVNIHVLVIPKFGGAQWISRISHCIGQQWPPIKTNTRKKCSENSMVWWTTKETENSTIVVDNKRKRRETEKKEKANSVWLKLSWSVLIWRRCIILRINRRPRVRFSVSTCRQQWPGSLCTKMFQSGNLACFHCHQDTLIRSMCFLTSKLSTDMLSGRLTNFTEYEESYRCCRRNILFLATPQWVSENCYIIYFIICNVILISLCVFEA